MTTKRNIRRGVTSVLAMLYLVLFGMLAIGFYAATSIASQVVYNELRSAEALLAAETGMDFMRYALHGVAIAPDTPTDQILPEVWNDLDNQLAGTGNLGSNQIGLTATKIEVPQGANSYIRIDGSNVRFRAEITQGTAPGTERELTVKVIGAANSNGSIRDRAGVTLVYKTQERPTQFFDYGMASKGAYQILTKNMVTANPPSLASVLSLSMNNPPVTIGASSGTPGGIQGDIYILPGAPSPNIYPSWSVGGSTIHGDIITNHVHTLPATDPPKLPVPDTSMYRAFATNTYVPGFASYENIVIPANTNPIINSGTDIKGVIYIQQPNKVSFQGNVSITGIIVSEGNGIGTLLTNQIIFSGNGGSKQGVEALPDVPQFTDLKKLGGSFIIAPDFDVQLTGNFGNLNGHIVGDKVTLSGSTTSTVKGSVVATRNTLTIGGNSTLSLLYDPNQKHVGLRFDERYVPDATTWAEVKP
jgi:hypothetical protein